MKTDTVCCYCISKCMTKNRKSPTLESSRSLFKSTCTVNLEILTAKIYSICRISDILVNINFSDFIVFLF